MKEASMREQIEKLELMVEDFKENNIKLEKEIKQL